VKSGVVIFSPVLNIKLKEKDRMKVGENHNNYCNQQRQEQINTNLGAK